jgi:sialate O-acetylesterase
MISGELKSFAIAGNDKKWHWAKAVLSSDKVSARFAVRYAYDSNPREAHFYSKDGLSTSPF